jgi:hypothetical protein
MTGMILFACRGGIAEAILEDNGCWSCAAMPRLVRRLDVLYSPTRDRLLADGSAGRRYLEAAARWLNGTPVFGDGRPIPKAAQPLARGLRGNVFDRRSRRPVVPATKQCDRISERDAARMCGVGVRMIHMWVETAAWPMPQHGGAAAVTYGLSDVEGWLATGSWPAGVHFREGAEQETPPLFLRGCADGYHP